MADSCQCQLREDDGRFFWRTDLLLDRFQQRLYRLGKLSDPVQADDGQRTLDLVQVSTAEL